MTIPPPATTESEDRGRNLRSQPYKAHFLHVIEGHKVGRTISKWALKVFGCYIIIYIHFDDLIPILAVVFYIDFVHANNDFLELNFIQTAHKC